MLTLALLPLLAVSVHGLEFYSPAYQFGAMMKRQGGYYPTTHICGTEDTCAEACGPTEVTCPSTSGLYCYDPTLGETCCPDLSGNACSEGYFCTIDGVGTTYCCPDGVSLGDCGAAYSLTISLISETGSVAIPTASEPATAPSTFAAPTTTSLIHVSIPSSTITTIVPTGTGAPGPVGNSTITTASLPAQVTSNGGSVEGFNGAFELLAAGLVGLAAAL